MERAAKNQPFAVGYIRASTSDQAHTLETQRAAIEGFCAREGLTLVDVFTDAGVSGSLSIEQRPALSEALAAAEGYGAHLVVQRWDRLSRDMVASILVEQTLQKAGARVLSADGSGNGEDETAELIRNILRSMSTWERRIIAKRTRETLAGLKASGKRWNCRAPYGLRLSEDQKAVVPDASEQTAIDLMRKLYAEGMSLRDIARRLEAEGFQPRGKAWHPTTISRCLQASPA